MPGASSVDPDAEDKKVPSFGSSDAKSPRLDDEDNTKQRNHSASSVLSLFVQPRAVGVGGIRWLMSMRLLWKLIRKYFGVILLHSGRRRITRSQMISIIAFFCGEIPAQRGVELGVIQPIVIGFTSHE
ncbi:hypothetical protein V6N13_089626 [Hibiscus sabdariffa]